MRTGRSLTVCCSLLPGGDVCLVRGGSPCQALGGGVLPARSRGVSAWSGGSSCQVREGLPARSGGGSPCQVPGGFSLYGGAARRPPVNRITHTCKNITLATTSLRPVNMITLPMKFFTISPQYKNANIAKFVLAVPLKVKKTNKVWSLERYLISH